MEQLKKLKIIVWLLIGILVFEIGMLAYMFFPGNNFLWFTLLVIFVVCVYFSVIIMSLLRELGRARRVEE